MRGLCWLLPGLCSVSWQCAGVAAFLEGESGDAAYPAVREGPRGFSDDSDSFTGHVSRGLFDVA